MGILSQPLTQPLIRWLNQSARPLPEVPLSNFEQMCRELKPCDVLLVEGRTRVSEVIRQITQSSWTHAALYIGRIADISSAAMRETLLRHYKAEPEEQLLIESLLGRGTVANPISAYREEHLRICRPKGLSAEDSQKLIQFALSRLGLAYDFRQILDLARFLFPWALWPRRWRSSLFEHNSQNPTKTVCSTMIAEAFQSIQYPILPLVQKSKEDQVSLYLRNPKLYLPKDFDYSPYFEIVKYPFIDCCDPGSYRLLPWAGTNPIPQDEGKSE